MNITSSHSYNFYLVTDALKIKYSEKTKVSKDKISLILNKQSVHVMCDGKLIDSLPIKRLHKSK